MTEEQLDALITLMEAIASAAAGRATHQLRPRDNVIDAENWVRTQFDLPLKENDND